MKILTHFFITLCCSVLLTLLILYTNSYHKWLSGDNDLDGIQKYHTVSTPRIGGLAIYLSFAIIVIGSRLFKEHDPYDIGILFSSFIVFLMGFLEDITKKIPPMVRMVGFAIGMFIAVHITHNMPIINYTGFVRLDELLLQHKSIAIILSLFCVVGLTNAYNVIDGYNGIAAITAIANLIGLFILSILVADTTVMWMGMYFIAAILGFLIFNYPKGKIFLGDGGAYLLGFVIAVISIYLVHAHKGIISPYAVLLINAFPVTEVGFSVYRRKFIHKTNSIQPDNMHLHQLIYHRCVPLGSNNRNAMVMPLALYFILPPVALAIIFYKSTLMCTILMLLYIVYYVLNYSRLTSFRTFKFLKIML